MKNIIRFSVASSLAIGISSAAWAQAATEVIQSFTRPVVALRETLSQQQATRFNASELAVPAPVTGHEGDFVRFTDRASGRSWLVSRFDVLTNRETARHVVQRPPGCQQSGAMGMGRPC